MNLGLLLGTGTAFVFSFASANQAPGALEVACGEKGSDGDCSIKVAEAIKSAKSVDQVFGAVEHWDARFYKQVARLARSRVGAEKAKSDLDLIRDELKGLVPDAKDLAVEAAKKVPLPKGWEKRWKEIWASYFSRLSTFFASKAFKIFAGAAKGVFVGMQPSQIATDYDELQSFNSGVHSKAMKRWQELEPPPSFVDALRDEAYRRVSSKLDQSSSLQLRLPSS